VEATTVSCRHSSLGADDVISDPGGEGRVEKEACLGER
jgi:hypothetical protein